jgi:hypothetical protein
LPYLSRHILAGAAAALFVKSDTFNVVLYISIKGAVELCRALNSGVIRVLAGDDRAYRCKEWDVIISRQRFVSVALASLEKLMLLRRPDKVDNCNQRA